MAWWWCVGTAASDRPSMAASWVPGRHADLVRAVAGALGRVTVVAHQVGQVLMQGAAERDVDDLQATADAEHRQPAG